MNRRRIEPQRPDNMAVTPLAVKPKVACRMLSCGITRLYELLGLGELESYRDGRSRLIVVASIQAYVAHKLAETRGVKAT